MSDHLTLICRLPDSHEVKAGAGRVPLHADRVTLAKRRWRGKAEDGREFGFDLAAPAAHGDCFWVEGGTAYVIEQKPEEVIEIPVTAEQAPILAWQIGNLHLGVQVLPSALRVADDPAVVQLIAREHLTFQRHTGVFVPISAAGGGHHPHHAHD